MEDLDVENDEDKDLRNNFLNFFFKLLKKIMILLLVSKKISEVQQSSNTFQLLYEGFR